MDLRALVTLPNLYPAQSKIKTQAARFNVLDIGRRAGKTYLGIHLALESVACGHPVGWFAPAYKYLLEVWQTLTRELRPYAVKINATERRIELSNGGLIECWTLDGTDDPGRSRRYKLAIVDEAAIAPNLKTIWEQAIRPTLTDLRGSAWFLSTPKGLNYFHDLFQRGQDTESFPEWRSWHMPSSVNPYLPASELDIARDELPEAAFKQEYLAEFLQNEGAVFRNIDNCLKGLYFPPLAHKHHNVVAGVDWARQHDFTAISILCCECGQEVHLDRFNQIGWDFQRERIVKLLAEWGVKDTVVESNSIGAPNLEALHSLVPDHVRLRGFETTAKSKPPLIRGLALALEKASVQWLPDPVGRHELLAYEATITKTGYAQYSAPEGGWDDTVIARALAWKAASYYLPLPTSAADKIENQLVPELRVERTPAETGWVRDGWQMRRDIEIGKIKQKQADANKSPDDPWSGWAPENNAIDDPYSGWSPNDE